MLDMTNVGAALAVAVYAGVFALAARALRLRGPWLRATAGVPRASLRRAAVHLVAIGAVYLACVAMFVAVPGPERWVGSPEVKVVEQMPAATAGLVDGDRLISVNGAAIVEFGDASAPLKASRGAPVPVVFERGGERKTIAITPDASGRIGVLPLTSARQPMTSGERLSFAAAAPLRTLWSLSAIVWAKAAGELEEQRLGGPMVLYVHSEQLTGKQLLGALAMSCSFGLVPIALLTVLLAWWGARARRTPTAD